MEPGHRGSIMVLSIEPDSFNTNQSRKTTDIIAMAKQSQHSRYYVWHKIISICMGAAVNTLTVVATAQTPPENHLEHHPDQAESGPLAAAAPAPAEAQSMMENMQEMMREMLAPPQKELYPLLMELRCCRFRS